MQQLGEAKEIYERPHNMFVADFIGETNLLDVSVDQIQNGRAICHLGGGHELTCNEVAGVGVGSKVHMSMRPGTLFLSDEPTETESLKGQGRRQYLHRHRYRRPSSIWPTGRR